MGIGMEKEGECFRLCCKCVGFFCFNGFLFFDVFVYFFFLYYGIVFFFLFDNVRKKYQEILKIDYYFIFFVLKVFCGFWYVVCIVCFNQNSNKVVVEIFEKIFGVEIIVVQNEVEDSFDDGLFVLKCK